MDIFVTIILITAVTIFVIYRLILLFSKSNQQPAAQFCIPTQDLVYGDINVNQEPEVTVTLPQNHKDQVPQNRPIWSLDFIQSLEWREFEKLCCTIMTEQGFRVEQCQLGPDGGIDICIYSKEAPQTLIAIGQCKAWSNKLGEKTLREFCGVMADRKISKGYFFTSGDFFSKTKEFGKRNQIELINGPGILRDIKKLSEETQESILSEIIKTDYTIPTCVRCGIKMQLRDSKFGTSFWGCRNFSRFPKCTFKLNIKKKDNHFLRSTLPFSSKNEIAEISPLQSYNGTKKHPPRPELLPKSFQKVLVVIALVIFSTIGHQVKKAEKVTKLRQVGAVPQPMMIPPTTIQPESPIIDKRQKVAWASGDEQIYTWIDNEGRKHYTNEKKSVAPSNRSIQSSSVESRETAILVKDNNVILIPVTIENKGTRIHTQMIVDTGCSLTLIHYPIVKQLRPNIIGKGTSFVADGREVENFIFTVETLEVGPFTERNFTASTNSMQNLDKIDHQGLLGMAFLKKTSFSN